MNIDSYEKAQQKLKVLETTSDIETDVEARRKPNYPQKFKEFLISEHSSSSEDLPLVPKKPTIFRTTRVENRSTASEAGCFMEELREEVEPRVEPTSSNHSKELYGKFYLFRFLLNIIKSKTNILFRICQGNI